MRSSELLLESEPVEKMGAGTSKPRKESFLFFHKCYVCCGEI